MSLWFEGYLAVDLLPNCPQTVVDILAYMTRQEDYEFTPSSDETFFEIDGWRDFLQVHKMTFGLPGLQWSDFHYATHHRTHYRHTLSFRRLMHDDVEFYMLWWYFLLWIAPFVETRGFVGFYKEKYSLHPTMIYLKDGAIYMGDLSTIPKGTTGPDWDDDPQYVLQP